MNAREDDRTGNREIMKAIGVFITGIGMIAAAYVFLVTPQYKKVQEFKKELAILEVKSRQYKNFWEFEGRIAEQRERVDGVLRTTGVEWILTDTTDQGIFDALGRICNETDIRMDKIARDQSGINGSNGQQRTWVVSFKAPYDKLVVVISRLEKAFVIDKFRIDSGLYVSGHTVSMHIHPIDIHAAAPASILSGKDLFDMYDELEILLRKLATVPGPGEQSRVVLKDPMLFGR